MYVYIYVNYKYIFANDFCRFDYQNIYDFYFGFAERERVYLLTFGIDFLCSLLSWRGITV